MIHRLGALVATVSLIGAGCGATASPAASQALDSPPASTAAAGASLAPNPTPASSPVAPGPSFHTAGPLAEIRATLIPWKDGVNADANAILEVRNISASAIDTVAKYQDYTITDSAGGIQATGEFTNVYPYEIAPGAIGYVAQEIMVSDDTDPALFVHLTATTAFVKATHKDIALTVSDTANEPGLSGYGAATTGMVTNTSKIPVEEVAVAAFYYDADGNVIGYSFGGPNNLGPGKTKPFVTDTGTPPLNFRTIARTVVIAESLCRDGPCLP